MATLKELYDALKSDGAPLPETYEKFKNYMTSGPGGGYEHRKKVYDSLKADGAPLPDTYEAFSKSLFSPAAKPSLRSDHNKGQQEHEEQQEQQQAQQVWKPTPMQKAFMMGRIREDADATIGDMRQRVANTRRLAQSQTEEGRNRQKAAEMQARMAGTPTKVLGLSSYTPSSGGGEAGASPSQNPNSPVVHGVRLENGEVKTEWMLPDGSLSTSFIDADKAEYGARKARLQYEFLKRMEENGLDPANSDDVEKQKRKDLLDVSEKRTRIRLAENEENLRELNDRKAERLDADGEWRDDEGFWQNFVRIVGGAAGRSVTANVRRPETSLTQEDRERGTYLAENQVLDEARKQLETRRLNKSEGFMGGFWKLGNNWRNMKMAARHTLSDADLYAGGVMALQKATRLTDIEEKLGRGEDLTDAEVSLVYSTMLEQDVRDNTETPHGYNAMQITVEMFPFMAQMLLNPASGLSRAMVTKFGKAGLRKIATRKATQGLAGEAAEAFAKKEMRKLAAKTIGVQVAGDVAEATVLANTLQAPKTAADAIGRYQGNVTEDEKGNLSFDGSHDWGEAVYKAESAAIIENYTEMLGEHFGIIGNAIGKGVGKGLRAIGGGKVVDAVSDMIGKINSSEWVKAISEVEKRAHWNGTVGEVLEEEAGIVLNSIFTGDNNISDLWDADQQIDIVLGVGLFGGFVSGLKTIGYPLSKTKAKSNLRKSDGIGSWRFGDEWGDIRDRIDNAEEKDLGTVIRDLVRTHAKSEEQGKAIVDYAHALMRSRGFEIASASARSEGTVSLEQQDVEDSFEHGEQLAEGSDPQAMNDAKREMERSRQKFVNSSSEDFVSGHFDGADAVDNLLNLGPDPELRQQAADYVNAKAVYEGMIQRVRDDVDGRVAQSDAMIESRVNRETGMIQPAVYGPDKKTVYIINGTVAMSDDGSGIDTSGSSESVIIREAETGKVEFADPRHFVSVEEGIDAEAEKEAARAQIIDEVAVTATNSIDGVLPMTPGDTYTVADDEGNRQEVSVLGETADENGMPVGGSVDIQYPDGTIQSIETSELQERADVAAEGRVSDFAEERDVEREKAAVSDSRLQHGEESGLDNPGRDRNLLPDSWEMPYYGFNTTASRYIESEKGTGGILYRDDNGNDAIVVSALDNDNYVGYFREYDEQGNPTNRWSAKFQNGSGVRENYRDMMQTAQELLPAGHELTEHTSVSTDGLRNLANQLKHGYELQYDEQGNIVTTEVAVNMMAKENALGLDQYTPGSERNIRARLSEEEQAEVGQNLLPFLRALGLNEDNFRWRNNTLYVDHPVLRRADTPQQTEQAAVTENAESVPVQTEDAEIHTENRDLGTEGVPETEIPVDNVQQTDDGGFVETMAAREEEVAKPSALSQVPTDENGEPVYEQVEPDAAWDALVEQTEGDEEMAQSVIEQTIAEKEEELKRLSKQKPKSGLSISQKIQAEKERKKMMEGIQQSMDHWRRMGSTRQRRQVDEDSARREEARRRAEEARAASERERAEREEAERVEREALNGVPDWSRDTPQDARARGYRRNGPQKVDRQEPLMEGGKPSLRKPSLRSGHNVEVGKEVEVKFSDKELPKGHAAIIDAGLLQPSHIQGSRNPLHFLDEAQPKERDDAASVLSAQKIASNIRPEEITSSVTAYTGAPTVNLRGETIQGNSRSDALRLMYESRPEQAARYKQYLIDHAADFGLTPEQISSVENPVLVNMLDVADDEAIRLGQFVAQDTESGGIERIKPKNAVQKMGNRLGSFSNILLGSMDDEASLSQLIEANGVETLKWMLRNGFITDTQYGSAFDSKGELSAKAAEDLKGILYQSVFTGGSTRLEEMFNKLPAKAQRAILATAFRDFDSRREDSMVGELQQSIIAFYDISFYEPFASATNLKDAMDAALAWSRQYAFDDVSGESVLPAEKFSNFALRLAAIYRGGTQKSIQQTFNDLYDAVQGTAQDTLFEEADKTPKSLSEAIRKVLDMEYQPVKRNEDGENRGNAVDVDSPQGEAGRPGVDGDASVGERNEEREESADGRGGAPEDSGRRDDVTADTAGESSLRSDHDGELPGTELGTLDNRADIEQDEEALLSRIEVKDDDWAEGGGYTPTLKRTVVVDGKHEVIQVDAPDRKGNYTGSVYEYDGRTFGDLREVVNHIDGRTVCPVCGKAHIPDYKSNDVICPQCGTDLSVFRQIDQLSDEEKQELSDKFIGEDNQGNPIDHVGKLIVEEVKSIDEITDEDFTNPSRTVELPILPSIVQQVLSTNGKKVIIKKNIFKRNALRHDELSPEMSRTILKESLYNPTLYGKNRPLSRPNNWIVINIPDGKGNNKLVVLEINERKDNVEIVHWHEVDNRGLEKIKRQAEREDGQLLILPSETSEEAGALSGPTFDLPSDGKDNTLSSDKQDVGAESSDLSSLRSDHDKDALHDEVRQWLGKKGLEPDETSSSAVMRYFKIGYNRAGKILNAIAEENAATQQEDTSEINEFDPWNALDRVQFAKLPNKERMIDVGWDKANGFPSVLIAHPTEDGVAAEITFDGTKWKVSVVPVEEWDNLSVRAHRIIDKGMQSAKQREYIDKYIPKELQEYFESGQALKDNNKNPDRGAKEKVYKDWGIIFLNADTHYTNHNNAVSTEGYTIEPKPYTNKQGKTLDTHLVTFDRDFSKEEQKKIRSMAKEKKGWQDRETGGYMLRSREDAEEFAASVMAMETTSTADAPVSLSDIESAINISDTENPTAETPSTKVESKHKVGDRLAFGDQEVEVVNIHDNGNLDLRDSIAGIENNLININPDKVRVPGSDESVKYWYDIKLAQFKKLKIKSSQIPGMRKQVEGKVEQAKERIEAGDKSFVAVEQMAQALAMEQVLNDIEMDKVKLNSTQSTPTPSSSTQSTPTTTTEQKPEAKPVKKPSKWVDDEDAEEFERLRNILRNGLGQLNMGFPPELLYAGAKMSYLMMKHGVRKFAEYATAMIEELGDAIRPHLKALYNFTRSTDEVTSSEWANELTPFDEVMSFDTANFDKAEVDAMATAENIVAEQESQQHLEDTVSNIKDTIRQNPDGTTTQTITEGGVEIEVTEGDFIPGVYPPVNDTQNPGKKKPSKSKPSEPKPTTGQLDLFGEEEEQIINDVIEETTPPEAKPEAELSGDSADYQERSKQERDLVDDIVIEIMKRTDMKERGDDRGALTMRDIRGMLENYNLLSDISATDLQELVERAMTILTRQSEKSNNRTSQKFQKKSVSSQNEQPGLFGGLFDEDVTPTGNDIRRNDAVSTQRLPSDNSGLSEGNRENPGTQSQRTRQESERTDRGREESEAERTRPMRPRLSRLTEEERKNQRNNRAERGTDYAPKGEDARIKANIAAIELAQRLTGSGEQATPEQMAVLRKFSGWGGLGKAFTNNAYAERIRNLLGDSYQDAVDSRKSAYYTPAAVIDSLWDIAKGMGFQGGAILEGSAGIGNILGLMPEEISERSNIRAVEVDSTTGSILSLLYPDAQVDIQGFEETRIENGSIDLAITNVPFITGWNVIDKTGDKDLSKKFKDIHDFCIAKNIRKLREGGIGIFITSSGTLDNSAKLRSWITNEGSSDVVGAFRMHNETFGGTGATSDIIVVRKRVNGKKSAHAIDVSEVSGVRTAQFDTGETKKVKVDGHKQEIPVVDTVTMDYNRYFVEHPEQMAGEMHFGFEKSDNYRAKSKALYPVKEKNQEAMLSAWAQSFSAMDFEETSSLRSDHNQDSKRNYDAVGNEVKVGSMIVDDRGRLCVNSGGIARPLMSARKNKQDTRTDDELISMFNSKKIKGRTRQQCLKDYNAIKKALSDVLEYQTTHEDNDGLEPLLTRLNATFDSFVSRYGNLHKNTQLAWLRNDVDYPGILALETYEERDDESGNRIKKFGKTDIFSRRVVEKETIPQPKNIKDGIITSLYISGRVDVGYIAGQLGMSDEQVRTDIVSSGLGFENPVSREMEVSYEYLSGNVREKLRQAEANNVDGRYNTNIKALEKVIPMNIPAHLIEFALGSSWIDPQLYEDYTRERTGLNVKLTNVGGTWFMKSPDTGLNTEQNRSQGVYSEELKKTVFGHEILEAAITNRSISVSRTYKKSDGSYETITDRDATQAVAAKVDEFRLDFKDWARAKMQGDMEMSVRMESVYNDRFNNSVPRSIPDEFIPKHFGGQVTEMGGEPFSLHPHQAKAVIRGTTQSQLLAHEVGTGKTFTLISTAMEMRRLGTARKPMIVVQNATVGQFVESAKALYPNAKVLTLEDADRNAQGRKDFYAKIRYNDWDMIVIPQSVLDMIPDSEERQIRFIQDKIAEKMLVLQQMAEQDPDGSSWITKQAEKEISDLENDLAKITESLESKLEDKSEKDMKKEAQTRHNAEVRAMEMLDRTTDDVENFDQMGIDALLVDEAHEYKHLGFATAMQRGVKGVDPSYSKKAQGLYLKTQAVMERNKGRNVIFATGTPISNTAAEIWTFMRYLMPEDEMKDYGIYYFDDFVRNFGNIQQMLEFGTNGKFKENNRFAGYFNLPELVRIWSTITDTVLTREAGEVSDKIPEMEGGKAQDIYLPQTKALRSVMLYVKSELDRYDKMTGKEKKANSHIPLTMYGIAKAAAVDARLVYSDAADEPQSKTNEAVRQTLRSLEEASDYKGTVAIFADNYQNKQSGFNLYEDIRRKLIEHGVPAEQIVVMKSGMTVKKKLEIFDKVNAGEVRVILGSTYTLGTGVNIQERLHTLIHLDAPNRPMDYTQRNGRILRQGNLHKDMDIPVRVLRFGVEDSLDVTAYQRLKTKGAIADSIMNGSKMMENSMEIRSLEEDEDVFGDITAQLSGSEYAILKNQAEKEVRKLNSKLKQWEADQTYIHNQIPRLNGLIRESEKHQKTAQDNLNIVRRIFPDGTFKTITIGKQTFSDLESMNKLFTEHNKSVMDVSDQIRDNKISGPQTRKLTIDIDGLKFEITTVIDKEIGNNGGNLFSKASRKITYSCPELQGVVDIPVSGARLKGAVEDIVSNLITGKDYSERVEAMQSAIDRNQSELQQIEQRKDNEFEFYAELEEAKSRLEEYTEKMKAELAEKEAKYADMDAGVEAASEISLTEEDSEESEDEDVRYRLEEDIESLNDRFNNELEEQIRGNLPPGHIYSLGHPGEILLSTGVPDYPIQMSASRLRAKSSEYGHDFDLEEVKNLVMELRQPIAVFSYGNKDKAQNIIVGIESNGKQFIVGLSLSPTVGGKKLEINSIRNVFPKNNAEWLNWISQDKLLWADKEKIQGLIDKQRTILADVEYLDLDDIAKIVKSFENPTIISSESLEREGIGAYSDAEVSFENDPWSKAWGESIRTKRQQKQYAERERKRMRERAESLSQTLGVDIEVLEDASALKGKKQRAKGWYDPRTGKITVVVGNHSSASDMEATILHEAVAHHGLRELLGEHFDEFLDKVYDAAENGIKERIDLLATRNGWNRRVATEEYLAGLAEQTDFERAKGGWFDRIKRFFIDMLRKAGFKNITPESIGDNELRYVLWRSYQNLVNPGRHRAFEWEAEDVARQYELGVGDFAPEAVSAPDENTVLFRDGDFTPRDRVMVADEYERMLSRGRWQFQEAVQDSMLGLKTLYESILTEGDKSRRSAFRIDEVAGYENAYLYENRMSSTNNGEQHQYFVRFMKPLLKSIHELCGSDKLQRRILTDYMIAKHGLERNEYMRNEAASNGEETERDFAGLCGLTGQAGWQKAESDAQQMVDDYEADHDTAELWSNVRKATGETLEKIYLSGLISEDTYNKVLGMYDFYIPLRGWDETTSDEVYGYLTSKDGPLMGSVFKSAEGRESKADDPIATIAMMADDAIRQGNRNIMKQRFLNFVHGHPSDLVSVNELWLQHDDVTGIWEPVFADLQPDMTHAEVENEIAKFEARMEALRSAEPDKYKKGREARNIPYKVVRGNLNEHQVLVKRNGRTYIMTINGNPRAAQALNGLTNPDVEGGGVIGGLLKLGEYVNRNLSAFYTTRNPDFVVSNFLRDMLYSNCMTWVKENPRYALRFHRNFGRVNPMMLRRLLSRWEKDTLSDGNYLERMFKEFMLNGGETGYTSVKDIEGHKRTVAKELRKRGSIGRKAWNALGMQFELLNRSAENCARFAAFLTSREMGRTLDRSIYDAKEVSVNFNKKGSGGKFVDATGQKLLGKIGSHIGGWGRVLFVFWNAGVQGLTNFGRAGKRNPGKALGGATALFTLGCVIPLLAQMLGGGDGDDDDKNAYYNLPEYVRRSNICFKAGDQWITIPLPIEYRAIYGMGELASGVISGNERYGSSELTRQMAAQISQIMPLDMLEGGGGISPFIPSVFKPLTEAYILNRGWTGLPVSKDTPFNKNDPEWTKAYQSADQHLVTFARWLNETTGGDDYKKGAIDINPAKLEYLLSGTFGGVVSTAGKLKKMGETAFGDREFEWRNMLLANRVIKSGDERTANRKLQNEYFKYKKEYEETGRLLKKYENADDAGILGYAERADFLYNSEEYLRYGIFEEYKPDIDEIREGLKDTTDPEIKKELQNELFATMRELVNALHSAGKSSLRSDHDGEGK